MILMESTRLHPVYTWHEKELSQLLTHVLRLIRKPPAHTSEEKIRFLGDLYWKLDRLLWILREEKGPVVYLGDADLRFVKKVAEWVKTHPEKPEGVDTTGARPEGADGAERVAG